MKAAIDRLNVYVNVFIPNCLQGSLGPCQGARRRSRRLHKNLLFFNRHMINNYQFGSCSFSSCSFRNAALKFALFQQSIKLWVAFLWKVSTVFTALVILMRLTKRTCSMYIEHFAYQVRQIPR